MKRLIPAGVVDRVDTAHEKVFVRLTKDQVKHAPDFDERHRRERAGVRHVLRPVRRLTRERSRASEEPAQGRAGSSARSRGPHSRRDRSSDYPGRLPELTHRIAAARGRRVQWPVREPWMPERGPGRRTDS
jgi:hypothetical protein